MLACGPGAILSHLSAAHLWGMRAPRGDGRPHVTVVAGRARPPGVVVHRTRRISRADITVERGIRVTTPARTVIDVADITTYDELRTLADHGVRLDDARSARARPGGAPNVARLLDSGIRTRSKLERALRRMVRTTGLPSPASTRRSSAASATRCGASSDSWSRSTATVRTPRASRARTTTRGTRRWSPPAGASCASPTPRSSASRRSWPHASRLCSRGPLAQPPRALDDREAAVGAAGAQGDDERLVAAPGPRERAAGAGGQADAHRRAAGAQRRARGHERAGAGDRPLRGGHRGAARRQREDEVRARGRGRAHRHGDGRGAGPDRRQLHARGRRHVDRAARGRPGRGRRRRTGPSVRRPTRFGPVSVNHSAPSGPVAIPLTVGLKSSGVSVTAPDGVMRSRPLARPSPTHRAPSGPVAIDAGPEPEIE